MNVAEALYTRQSVRAYLNKPVPEDTITKILQFARYAPSGTNTQPWEVAVVSGQSKEHLGQILLNAFTNGLAKDLDYNYYPLTFSKDMQKRRVACGLQLYGALGISREDKEARLKQWALNYLAFNAPTMLFFFTEKFVEKGSFMDYGMFLQSLMLMAVEEGLATCPQAALAEYPHLVKEYLGYSDDKILLCGMAIGYEDPTAKINSYKTPREEVAAFTRFFS